MADTLISAYGDWVPRRLAAELQAVSPGFDVDAFLADALLGYDALPLMARAAHLADALARHLPSDYPQALQLLLASLGPPQPSQGMAAFFHLPHSLFVARQGLGHFDLSMAALAQITQHFSAEFAIRPLLDQDPQAAEPWLWRWSAHASPAVRRLVSEGSRPRLPWAARLCRFRLQDGLLAALRDDASPVVRRSVANHLNDIGKDDAPRLLGLARRWWPDAPPPRQALLRHALRSLVKQGDAGALALLGAGAEAQIELESLQLHPRQPRIGDTLLLRLALRSRSTQVQRLVVDLCVGFVKADGRTRDKVFKLRSFELGPGESRLLEKRLQLADLSTRRHHPGPHRLALQINGRTLPLDGFELLPPAPG